MYTIIFGLIFGIGILLFSLTGISSQSKLYLDFYSFVLVLGGTISASLMSITWKNLKEIFVSLGGTFFKSSQNGQEAAAEMVEIADKAAAVKKLSNLSHSSKNGFVEKGIRLLQSDLGPEEIRKIMADSILNEKSRVTQNSGIIKMMAKYPPSFGMVGTILGLIGLLEEMNISTGMDKIGIKMAMALVTTLYGLLLSNYVLLPISEIMINKYQTDLKIKKMILESFILIASNKNDPVMVREYLADYGVSSGRDNVSEISGEAA